MSQISIPELEVIANDLELGKLVFESFLYKKTFDSVVFDIFFLETQKGCFLLFGTDLDVLNLVTKDTKGDPYLEHEKFLYFIESVKQNLQIRSAKSQSEQDSMSVDIVQKNNVSFFALEI